MKYVEIKIPAPVYYLLVTAILIFVSLGGLIYVLDW